MCSWIFYKKILKTLKKEKKRRRVYRFKSLTIRTGRGSRSTAVRGRAAIITIAQWLAELCTGRYQLCLHGFTSFPLLAAVFGLIADSVSYACHTPYPQLSHVGISPGPAQSPRGSFNPIPDCIILASIFFTSSYLYSMGTCHLFIWAMSVVSFRFRIFEYWLPILSSHFMPFMSTWCPYCIHDKTL